LGNLTQTGALVISSLEKSKNLVIGFKIRGLPYTLSFFFFFDQM